MNGAAAFTSRSSRPCLWGAFGPWREPISRPFGLAHARTPSTSCVHADARLYGLRSSTILAWTDASKDFDMRFADGPPCVTSFVPVPMPWALETP